MKTDTQRKLEMMRLPAFAAAYEDQSEKETDYETLSFHERLALLVDAEYDARHNNRIQRLIKQAGFSNTGAFLNHIDYFPDRHLNRDLLTSLADNRYIQQAMNILLIGATGSGKTYIGNALGMNACQAGYKTKYIRLPELFAEFELARVQGKYLQLIKQYRKYALVILDEFLLIPTNEQEQRDLLEIMEYRCNQSATIFCSQFTPEGWHERLGGGALADAAILDRIISSAYTMTIGGSISMRQRKKDPQEK